MADQCKALEDTIELTDTVYFVHPARIPTLTNQRRLESEPWLPYQGKKSNLKIYISHCLSTFTMKGQKMLSLNTHIVICYIATLGPIMKFQSSLKSWKASACKIIIIWCVTHPTHLSHRMS